jgi:hypothetical protein
MAFVIFFLVCLRIDGVIIAAPIAAAAPPTAIPKATFDAVDFTLSPHKFKLLLFLPQEALKSTEVNGRNS